MFIFQTLKNEKEALNLDRSILYSSYWFKDTDYIIPSPKRWYMFLFQFIEPYAGYKVDEYGNYYELKYALVVKRKIKKEVLQDLKYAYTFIMLFVLFLSWTLKSVNYGLIIVAFIYWNNSQLFLQKGEEWKKMVY